MSSKFLIDVHAHLEDEKFSEDVRETIDRATAAGIKRIINVHGFARTKADFE